jgi:signal peptidase II
VLFGSVIVGVLLFVFLMRVHPADYVTITGGALVTGGALGNLYDRIQYRYVIDFIHATHWPTFNVADVCITVGVLLIVFGQLRDMRHPSDTVPEASERTS